MSTHVRSSMQSSKEPVEGTLGFTIPVENLAWPLVKLITSCADPEEGHREYQVSVFWYQVYQARLWERLLTSRGLPSDSICVLKAEPGKLDIKRREPGILFISLAIVEHSSNQQLWRNFWFLCWFSVISDVIKKVQRHHDLIKVTCREIGNVY